MAITYEEALSTLTSMFGSPWTEEHLDTVLRHHEGHMENTVETVLGHGEGAPQDLLDKLSASNNGPDQVERDAQLAQQLAMEQRRSASGRVGADLGGGHPTSGLRTTSNPAPTSTPVQKKGRGTPTSLPDDFLRIPGQQYNSADNDAVLARMLQDKLFADELKNNPEFAHLARGNYHHGRAIGHGTAPGAGYPGSNRGQHQGLALMEAISGMGENAKRRLQELGNKFKAINQNNRARASGGAGGSSGAGERRGLLGDSEEQEVSFIQKQDDYEMRSMSSTGDKKQD
jgi:hypothetical protein